MTFFKKRKAAERRNYIRLSSVFPVQFRLLSPDGKHFLSEWLQGFTNNVSKGGLCLMIRHLNSETAQLFKSGEVLVSMDIEMPIFKVPASATATVAWMRDIPAECNGYLVGLDYREIDRAQNAEIMRYARMRSVFIPALFTILCALVFAFVFKTYQNILLTYGNRVMTEEMQKVLRDSGLAEQKIGMIVSEQKALKKKLHALLLNLQALEQGKAESAQERAKIERLNTYITQLGKEKEALQKQLSTLGGSHSVARQELKRLDKRETVLRKENIDTLYRWLVVHQNPRTGLVASFEGDSEVADWAFAYDQSLVAQAYILFGDFEKARKVLDFFREKAKRIDGRFVNAYYVKDGAPAEYIVHSGPNIWVGIAALHYTDRTNDKRYLPLAEEIAGATMHLQKQDPEGGLRGGPDIPWYATEHNLDAYAFFDMLSRITGKTPYAQARDKILNWLQLHTYDKTDIPILRGKGDSTIATDTYAWSIASLGPQKLQELKMDPDEIVAFAEETCAAEVSFTRPDGSTVPIKGFDFAPQKHVARGGVVSSEWTAQMCMAFRLMADFCQKKGMTEKAKGYEEKADSYLVELSRMMISSRSPTGQGEGCLPYATQASVDTGHGWRTPKGKATGSIAGTAYTLFAYYNYNPLELKE